MILRTFRLHSSAARSKPAESSSLPRSPEADAATGAKGSTASALLNFFCENFSHIWSMLSCGGFLGFFFFLSSLAGPLVALCREGATAWGAGGLWGCLWGRCWRRRWRGGEGAEDDSESESEDEAELA